MRPDSASQGRTRVEEPQIDAGSDGARAVIVTGGLVWVWDIPLVDPDALASAERISPFVLTGDGIGRRPLTAPFVRGAPAP